MNITVRSPWSLIDELEQRIDPWRDARWRPDAGFQRGWVPAVDIREEPDRFVLLADVPGVSPENIQVTTEQGVLTISGERTLEPPAEHSEQHLQERLHGRFQRRFTLPDTADTDQVQARGKDGVLAVVIPKKAKAQARRIEVERH